MGDSARGREDSHFAGVEEKLDAGLVSGAAADRRWRRLRDKREEVCQLAVRGALTFLLEYVAPLWHPCCARPGRGVSAFEPRDSLSSGGAGGFRRRTGIGSPSLSSAFFLVAATLGLTIAISVNGPFFSWCLSSLW